MIKRLRGHRPRWRIETGRGWRERERRHANQWRLDTPEKLLSRADFVPNADEAD